MYFLDVYILFQNYVYEIGLILDPMCTFNGLVWFFSLEKLVLNHWRVFQSKYLRRQCETQVYHWWTQAANLA